MRTSAMTIALTNTTKLAMRTTAPKLNHELNASSEIRRAI